MILVQIGLIMGFPFISQVLSKKGPLKGLVSPIIWCYAFGIIIGNSSFLPLDHELIEMISGVNIMIAIPLLLYSTNMFKWLKKAKTAFISFGLFIISGIMATIIVSLLMKTHLTPIDELAAMIVGLYTGGTPNMLAIGMAVEAEKERLVLMQTADVVVGGLYLIFITSIAHYFMGYILPDYPKGEDSNSYKEVVNQEKLDRTEIIKSIGLTLLILGSTLSLSLLLFDHSINTVFVLFTLTTISLLASFLPFVQKWKSPYETAEYFLLAFSVAIGLLADFKTIAQEGTYFIVFTGLVLILAVFFHLFFSKIIGIDRDTTLIVSTAGLYGPPFIGPVASAINNREIVFSGILIGLLGYAVGNYLGLLMFWVMQ